MEPGSLSDAGIPAHAIRYREDRGLVHAATARSGHRSAGKRRPHGPPDDSPITAIGLIGAGLSDTLVLTGWTPWGPLPQPNAYFSYDGEAERTKEWAIHCHASQVLLTDYTQYCSHIGRAYAALTREWAEGHSLSGRRALDRRPVRGRGALPDRSV